MCRLDVVLVGLLRGIDFENADLTTVLLGLRREQADDARLLGEARFLYLGSCSKVFFQILGMNLNFCQAEQHAVGCATDGRWLFNSLPQKPLRILVENHLVEWCKVGFCGEILLHAGEALSEYLRGNVGIIGTVE